MIILLCKVLVLFLVLLATCTYLVKDIFKFHLPVHQRTIRSKHHMFNQISRISRSIINLNYTVYAFFNRLFFQSYEEYTIDEIIFYPLKSCGGISVKSWRIDEYGLESDRMYMLGKFDEVNQSYKSVTQREVPMLSQVELKLSSNGGLCFDVFFENVYYFSLPRVMTDDFLRANVISEDPVQLWGVGFRTCVLENVVPQSFYTALQLKDQNVKLLYSYQGKEVKTNSPDLPKQPEYTGTTTYRVTKFQEYFPLLLMAKEDIDDVNLRLQLEHSDQRVTSANFRPNIVIRDSSMPYDIDDWYKFRVIPPRGTKIRGTEWVVTSKCPRCSIPNINPITGNPDPRSQISKLLSKYRRCDVGNPNFSFLGIHAVQLGTNYEINVDDKIIVSERRLNEYKPLK